MSSTPTLLVQTTYFDDEDRADAAQLGERLYDLLTRDRSQPLAFGPGIPVRVATKADRVDPKAAEHVLIVPVLGAHAFANESIRATALRKITSWQGALGGGRVTPLPTALAWRTPGSKLPGAPILAKWGGGQTADWDAALFAITLAAARLLADAGSPPRMFISHAKADQDGTEDVAKRIYEYAKTEAGVDAFFDTPDLAPGHALSAQRGAAAVDGVFLAVRSDAYASRAWCERELLHAKRAKVPTLTVDVLRAGEARAYPYGGNGPCVVRRAGAEVRPIVLRALVEWLRARHFHLEAGRTTADLPPSICLSRPPELLDVAQGPLDGREPTLVFYPDPEISVAERRILREAHPRLHLVTPSTAYRGMTRRATASAGGALDERRGDDLGSEPAPLSGSEVALSLSNTDTVDRDDGMTLDHMTDATVFLARCLVSAGAAIAYGGDQRFGGYDALLANLIVAYNATGSDEAELLRAYLPASPHAEHSDRDLSLSLRRLDEDPYRREARLPPVADVPTGARAALHMSDVRRVMSLHGAARVVIGGQTLPKSGDSAGYRGAYPGVVEEAWRAMESGVPLYVIGGFGGAAQMTADLLEGKACPDRLRLASFDSAEYSELRALASELRDDPDRARLGLPEDMDSMAAALRAKGADVLASDDASRAWNGLLVDDNRRLFRARDPATIARLVMKGLLHRTAAKATGKLHVTLVHGSITQTEGADAIAAATLSDLPLGGAAASLNHLLSSRVSEALRAGESIVPIPSHAIDADWLVVASLGSLASTSDLEQLLDAIEENARELARVARRHAFRKIAVVTFGGSLVEHIEEAADRMLCGLVAFAPSPSLEWFEIDAARFEALRAYFEERRDVSLTIRRVAGSPPRDAPALDRDAFVTVKYENETVSATVVPPDGPAIVICATRPLPAERLDALSGRRASTPPPDEIGRLGEQLAEAVFGAEASSAIRACSNHRLVILHDAPAGNIPFEAMSFGGHRPALERGVVRRPLIRGP